MESKYLPISGNRLLKIDYFFTHDGDQPKIYDLAEQYGEDYKIECTGAVLNSYLYHSAEPTPVKDNAGQNIFLNHYDLQQIAKAVKGIEDERRELPVSEFFD